MVEDIVVSIDGEYEGSFKAQRYVEESEPSKISIDTESGIIT